ncbi:MAG: TonB-dependent receptor plug domain-containing protein [Saprospiraceae bacterium]
MIARIFILSVLFPFSLFSQKDTIVHYLNQVVCTAMPCPTPVKNAVYAVKVIDQRTIQQRGVNNLEELLSGETNIRMRSDVLLGSGIQIGGVGGENVKVLIDGVPVIGRLNGNVDLSQINLSNVEKVEIIQGSLSSLYGSNSSGGVINIITRKSQIKQLEIQASTLLENINIRNSNLNAGYRFKKLLLQGGAAFYQFKGLPSDSDRSVTWNPKKQLSRRALVKYYLSDNQQISFGHNHFNEKVDNLGEVKLKNTKNAYAFDDFYLTTRNDLNLNYQGIWDKFSFQSTVGFNSFNRLKETFKTKLQNDEHLLIEGQQDTSVFKGFLTRSVGVYKFNSFLNVQAGLETYFESAQGSRIRDAEMDKPNFANINDVAFFASGMIHLFKRSLTLQPAFRVAYNSKYSAPVTPNINILYKPNSNWSIRASYARGFRAPSLKELYFNFIDINHFIVGSQNLKAEYSNNYLLSPSYYIELGHHNYLFETQLFYNHIKDRITLSQIDLKNIEFTYINIGDFKTTGINTSFTYCYESALKVKAAFSYTGFNNDMAAQSPGEKTYNFSPEGSFELNYTIPKTGVSLNILHRYIGRVPNFSFDVIGNKTNRGLLDDYQLLNATVSRCFFQRKINVTLGAKNLMNVQNINQTGAVTVGHGSGTSVMPVNFGRSYFVKLDVNLSTKR